MAKTLPRTLLLLVFVIFHTTLFAQQISTDIFGHLNYKSERGNYTASLEDDIFDNLVFTDNNENKITFEKKFLDLEHRGLTADKMRKMQFFSQLISRYRREAKYVAEYKVDIFGKVIIENNRDKKIEYGKDIFGNPSYEETTAGKTTTIKRDIFGDLVYQSGTENAKLGKNIFEQWVYSDSDGNEFKFSTSAWNKLKRRHRTEERVFSFLISSYLR